MGALRTTVRRIAPTLAARRLPRLHTTCVVGLSLALYGGCGTSPSRTGPSTDYDASVSPTNSNTSRGSGGTSGGTSAGGGVPTAEPILSLPIPTSSSGSPNAPECQRDTYEAERSELNLLLLLDLSGSMLSQVDVETGETQWEAVRQAIREFVDSPSADGLGISITYFPILSERTPCEAGTACSNGDACIGALCAVPTLLGLPYPCDRDADCFGLVTFTDGTTVLDRCVAPYACTNYDLQLCLSDEQCPNGDTCANQGPTVGVCPGEMSCNTDDYAVAKVPLQVLPTGRDALLASLDTSYVDVYSSTPTHVALAGAYRQLNTWRIAEPNKRSVVVLATDGMPEGCESLPEEDLLQSTLRVIDQAAQDDLHTFVIGVVPQVDETDPEIATLLAEQRAALESMATSGRTTSPFLVQADTSTTHAFLQALDEVRNVALACDYTLPKGTTNFNLVNVELSMGGDPQTVPKVEGPDACVFGGWYYDVDETSTNDVPTRVVLCPNTCAQAQQANQNRVDVVLGCPTIRQVL